MVAIQVPHQKPGQEKIGFWHAPVIKILVTAEVIMDRRLRRESLDLYARKQNTNKCFCENELELQRRQS